MRIALLSDIHGNLVALEAVLRDLETESPDAVICLGDVVVTGPQPRQVIAALQELHWPIVLGNTDAWLFDPQPWTANNEETQRLLEVELWSALQLVAEDLAFLHSFRPTITRELGRDQSLLCYHGSPRDNTDFIGPMTTVEELEIMLGDYEATIMAGGHTHQQMLRRYQSSLLVNPGSVGMPFQVINGQSLNPLWAEYALISSVNGKLQVDFRRIPIDLAELREAVVASGMPHADWWLKDWRNG
ncbi:MAG: metallophosphoesterase family protein [Candidatus Promineifilaceae bacterium]|nr:metallophosphoesterase family protein [Candidatus Promineifilaceae bacterium]